MPNYGLVINSKFRPFSYEEMLAPVQQSTEAHIELENAYGDLTTKAKTLESMLNRTTDKNEYNRYKDYLGQIESVSEDLAKNGLSSQSRKNLRDLNSAYMSEIAPMQTAAQLRSEKAKLQLEMETKNPNLRYDRRADQIGLSEYMNNPNLGFRTVNLDDVTNRVFQEASTLSKEILEGDEETLREVLGGDYYEQYKQRGLTREQVLATIMNKEGGSKALSDIINRNIERTGVKDWDNQDVYNQVVNAAQLGAWGAVGTAETQLVNNWKKQEALRQQYAKDRLSWKYPKEGDPNSGGNTTGISTWKDITDKGYKVLAVVSVQGKNKARQGTEKMELRRPGEDMAAWAFNSPSEFEVHGGGKGKSDASAYPANKMGVASVDDIPVEEIDMNRVTAPDYTPENPYIGEEAEEIDRTLELIHSDPILSKMINSLTIGKVPDAVKRGKKQTYSYVIMQK